MVWVGLPVVGRCCWWLFCLPLAFSASPFPCPSSLCPSPFPCFLVLSFARPRPRFPSPSSFVLSFRLLLCWCVFWLCFCLLVRYVFPYVCFLVVLLFVVLLCFPLCVFLGCFIVCCFAMFSLMLIPWRENWCADTCIYGQNNVHTHIDTYILTTNQQTYRQMHPRTHIRRASMTAQS